MSQIFISYRRSDSAADAGRLRTTLKDLLRGCAIFMDTSSIEPGAVWPDRLRQSLTDATAVLVVIGPDWIRAADEWGERLIDQETDWVRREIEAALGSGKPVIPLLVRDARMPPAERLPAAVAPLAERQAVELRNAYFEHDVGLIVSRIRALDDAAAGSVTGGPYPVAPPELPDPLSEDKLRVALEGALRHWRLVESPLPEDPSRTRVELCREFHFRTFRDAISFMNEVAPGCDIAIHHPRWENIWRSLRVALTTWDIGHRVSDRDVQLAKYFDRAFEEFPGAA
ncbi:4a-hydroxytetrahydrobiopterin dehydratase [Actinoplanes sp. NPDC049681]|uniref:4a-hydroxytetrahydrobiopterin dehydratase n=1 Tax=Actinoplanes sp. NPDC049681 TaxID=3363905 RepID=UPI0037B9E809